MRARTSGQLQDQILDTLADKAPTALSVKELHSIVIQYGSTSEGAIGQALAKLHKAGKVDLVALRPQRWTLASGTTHTAAAAPAPAPTPPPAPVLRAAPVARPGGTLYHPRLLAGRPDVEVLRDLRTAGKPVLLYGPPGTGKTSLIEAAYPDLLTLAGDGETTTGDLVGEYTQRPDGTFAWVDGPLVRAMTEGRCFFIDDCTLISPAVLATVYPAMDGRGEIVLTAHEGETIEAEPGFYVAGGHNPGVAGAILTEALASRFAAHIEVSTDYDLARSLGVPETAIQIAADLNEQYRRGETESAPQLRELLGYKDIAAVMGEFEALCNLVSIAAESDREAVSETIRRHTGHNAQPLSLGTQIPPALNAGTDDDKEGDDDDQQ
ncbi:AAA family ATPase [Glycomyces sp. L485]|uniref:AAA family ATPase n=1 Tax=Glycomyces sp. L485 TaxID=2909235 RepID=UPI001F4B7220|nr:AAA family ATPase [Glycomyces sp. L485]MCH7229990.1 AAA family ATPase [Glycomyces sp. L485]